MHIYIRLAESAPAQWVPGSMGTQTYREHTSLRTSQCRYILKLLAGQILGTR